MTDCLQSASESFVYHLSLTHETITPRRAIRQLGNTRPDPRLWGALAYFMVSLGKRKDVTCYPCS
jgi:hypothetical protein